MLAPGAQRLSNPPGRGQRAHQQQHRRFPQRVLRESLSREADHVTDLARVERAPDELVTDLAVQLGQRDRPGRQRRGVDEIGQRRTAPERAGLPQQRSGGNRVGQLAGCRQQGARLHCVPVGADQPVATGRQLQPGRCGAEMTPQPGDVAVQRGPGRVGGIIRPHRVEQLIDHDAPALRQRQQGEHSAALAARHVHRNALDNEPQRPEHLDSEPDTPCTRTRHAAKGLM